MNKKNSLLLLLLILLLATILRFWQLGTVPQSPDWDEAALGYNAYALLHTGRDEFGVFLPSVLRSFGDYKPALYAYLAIPSVALFGLTVFAVRLPSVMMGIIGILAIYFLVKELFDSKETSQKNAKTFPEILALVSAFLFAISPWQIQFSRTAFETNTGLTFNLLVVLFFLKGLRRPLMLWVAALIAGLNLSVYQSERVFTPLFVASLLVIYRHELFRISKKYLAGSLVIGVIAVLPTFLVIVNNPVSLQRVQGTSLLSQQTQQLQRSVNRIAGDKANNDLPGEVFDNRRVTYAKEIVAAYLSHFDLNWLFIQGDNPRHHAPGMGLLYLLDLPFLLFGIYLFIFTRIARKTKYLFFSWLFLAPVPAAITFEVPHAVRTMNMLPVLLVFTALGYMTFLQFLLRNQELGIKKRGFQIILLCIFAFFALFNFIYYLNQYFVQMNYFNAADWQYGYKQVIAETGKMEEGYAKIVVSNRTPLDESYIFFLFYLKYPPSEYQQISASGENLSDDKHFGKYEFRKIDWDKDKKNKQTLYVGSASDFPGSVVSKEIIQYPDGKSAFLFVDPKDNP